MGSIPRQVGVYILQNPHTSETYAGSGDLYKRENAHRCALEQNKHTNYKLQRAYNRDPRFEFIGVPVETRDEARDFEQAVIDEFLGSPLFLNIQPDARHCGGGAPVSEETRKKISEANRGKKKPPHVSEFIRQRNLGNQYGLGRQRTDEEKEICRQAAKRQWQNPEHVAKMRKPVCVNGVVYQTARDAAGALNVPPTTVFNRVNSPKFPEWSYVNKENQDV